MTKGHTWDRVQDWSANAESHSRLRLATALSAVATIDEVAKVVGRWGAPAAAASFANLAVYDCTTNQVKVTHAASLDSVIARKWAEFPIDTPTPLCTAILTGHAVLLGDLDAIARNYNLLLDDTITAGLQATASLPLRAADDSNIGALGLAWPQPQPFDALQISQLELVAELVARAAQQVRTPTPRSQQAAPASASGLEAVHALQEALLPQNLAQSANLEAAAAYLPASDAPMGGDWYDLFTVGDATCLVIGDIAGHGITATAAMAELKPAVRAYAVEDPTPSTIVTRVNRLAHQLHPQLTATLIVATLQPHTRTLWRCNAGHPPILRLRQGDNEYIPPIHGPNPMIGADPYHNYHQEAIQLRPGTTLLLYSDGLIEQPPEPIDHTMNRLLRFYQNQPSLPPERLVNESLLWRLRQGHPSDDICLMAVRLA